ncbi:Canalicular multispecific organic anion transporter 2, partial [Globisporangium splendens]
MRALIIRAFATNTSRDSMLSEVYGTFDADAPRGTAALHPQHRAWCVSRLLLSWVTPLMRLGHRKQLDERDMWPLQEPLRADVASIKFGADYARTRSMTRVFFQSFGWRFARTGVAFLVAMLCNLVGPVVLREVVSSLTNLDGFSVERTFQWVGALFAAQVTQALVSKYANFESELMAIEFIAAIKTLLYRKTLRLNAESRKEKSTGDIANIYTSDSDAIMGVAYLLHQVWLIPLQIAIVSYLLYDVLNVAAFAGIGMIVLILCVNHLLSQRLRKQQRIYRKNKDVRMKKVTELFKAIGIVKFNAWEERFLDQIRHVRAVEMRNLFKLRVLVACAISLMWGMPVFISIASFGVFTTVVKHELTPAVVFSSIALFQLIQVPLRQITQIVPMVIESMVGLERVSAFLEMSEIDPDNVLTVDDPAADKYIAKNVIVAIENGEFGWDDEGSPVLRDVNLEVKTGDFYVVHGTVGCGKSSLCSALLGEMVKRNGTVYVGGSVAYCSQQPWIQNMTVRDNILFGHTYDRKKYEKVLDACALTEDLKSLPAGEHTEIGERGVNVSGGQKARIALARACYSDASVYILDSPLSAVDAIVQNEIFQKCLLSLLRHKTIVLVTHNPEIIESEHITHAITINEVGTLVETRQVQDCPAYLPLVSPLLVHAYCKKTYEEDTEKPREAVTHSVSSCAEVAELNDGLALISPVQEQRLRTFSASDMLTVKKQKEIGRLIDEEQRVDGRVSKHVLFGYYHAVGGLCVLLAFVLSQIVWQALQIASDFWLGAWSSDSMSDSQSAPSNSYRLSIYTALGLASASMVVIRMLIVTVYGLRAARTLFDQMTVALLHAPMRFFDSNPIGRILTRYGGDVSTVDAIFPQMFGRFAQSLLTVAFSTITAAVVIQWRGLLLVPVVVVYCWIGAFYIRPARELQRLAKTTQAPVLNHLSESVDGSSIIRAFGQSQTRRFLITNSAKLDVNNKIWFAQLCVSQWFSLYIRLIGSVLVLVVTTSLVLLRNHLGAAIIGLAFSYALKVSQNLAGLVDIVTQIESAMVCPERIQEYIDIPQEPPHRIPTMDPPSRPEWPSAGSVRFEHVSFRYKEHDRLVLKDLSFTVDGGEKIGIVGRTGAGKSSLTMALFRINEIASGSISIDGVNVCKIGLKALREKLSIIPQNPVLFKGSLRSYLDPFGEFSDEELWGSIRQVGLSDRISNEEKKLECIVEENGENFSVGERQMLCMVRALLRHSRIVIFDEATAAIDHETDKALQQVIRTAFASSTVLTIAHRLDTILDSSRILVLDGGHIVEFASPAELVKKGKGHFFDLMQEGGYLDKFTGK